MGKWYKDNADFFAHIKSLADQVAEKTGLKSELVMAQWALESSYGESDLATRDFNLAGIKKNSKGSDHPSYSNGGKYAGYDKPINFARDYARIMNLETYASVRNAKTLDEQVTALGKSPWAEDKNYSSKIFDIIKKNNLAKVTAVDPSKSEFWSVRLQTFLQDKKNQGEFITAILTNPIIWIVVILLFIFKK